MSGKLKQKSASNTAGLATQSLNERILRECHALYTDQENGLVKIAESLGLNFLAPRKKITILLLGNHSAGKSSFVNCDIKYDVRVPRAAGYRLHRGAIVRVPSSNAATPTYIEEHVQRTGVAIETQGFTFITSGRKRESLTGNATLHLYPHFEPLRDIEGVTDYLTTEISTSKQKKFSLVTFVDTPGLVDGDMKYPFDVNESILWLGDLADLIFVFFDPIGQALCKRTLNLVEHLNEKHADRMRFYLSKADEAGHESDRQRVMMQIVQELCKRQGLNRTGFEMPTIYIPSITSKPSRCVNQIDEVCKEIEKTINQTIQNTLNSLERDCDQIAEIVDAKLDHDNNLRTKNLKARMYGMMYGLVGMTIPLLLLFTFLLSTSHKHLTSIMGENLVASIATYLRPFTNAWKMLPKEYENYCLWGILLFAVLLLLLAKFFSRTASTLSRRQKRTLSEIHQYVQTSVKTKKQALYQEYLHQSVAEHDL